MTIYTNNWMRQGLCAGKAILNTPVIDKAFFPHKGRPANEPVYKDYCNYCVVSMDCLKYALAHDLDGVWGNSTRSQRDLLPQSLVQDVIKEAMYLGWYEPRLVIEVPLVPIVESALHLVQEQPEFLTEADFLLDFEWEEYRQKIERTLESFEMRVAE